MVSHHRLSLGWADYVFIRFESDPAHCSLLPVCYLSSNQITPQMTLEKPRTLERCPGFESDMLEPNRNISIVQKRQEEFLTEKQLLDYYQYRKEFLTYLLRIGKDPQKAKGYSPYTVKNTADRTARFDLWVWNNRGEYQIPPDSEDTTAYMDTVAFWDISDLTKL